MILLTFKLWRVWISESKDCSHAEHSLQWTAIKRLRWWDNLWDTHTVHYTLKKNHFQNRSVEPVFYLIWTTIGNLKRLMNGLSVWWLVRGYSEYFSRQNFDCSHRWCWSKFSERKSQIKNLEILSCDTLLWYSLFNTVCWESHLRCGKQEIEAQRADEMIPEVHQETLTGPSEKSLNETTTSWTVSTKSFLRMWHISVCVCTKLSIVHFDGWQSLYRTGLNLWSLNRWDDELSMIIIFYRIPILIGSDQTQSTFYNIQLSVPPFQINPFKSKLDKN